MKLTSVLVSTTEEFQLSVIDIHRDVVCGTIISLVFYIYMYIVELPTCFPKYPNLIYVLIYIVLKYYCVLITNSYVLSIALYESRQTHCSHPIDVLECGQTFHNLKRPQNSFSFARRLNQLTQNICMLHRRLVSGSLNGRRVYLRHPSVAVH